MVVPPVSPPVARPNLTYAGNGLYVLYDDGKFVLQFGGEYPGRYSRADSVITFNFAAYSTAGHGRRRVRLAVIPWYQVQHHHDVIRFRGRSVRPGAMNA